MSLKKKDFIGGLQIVGIFLLLSVRLFLITYVFLGLVASFRDFPFNGALDVLYRYSEIVNILMFTSIGYVFYKADSHNNKMDNHVLRDL